jgi:hypothetical protein
MSISEDWMDARLLGYAFKRAVFMRAGVRGLLVFLFSWGKAGLAHLQVESVLGQVG